MSVPTKKEIMLDAMAEEAGKSAPAPTGQYAGRPRPTRAILVNGGISSSPNGRSLEEYEQYGPDFAPNIETALRNFKAQSYALVKEVRDRKFFVSKKARRKIKDLEASRRRK